MIGLRFATVMAWREIRGAGRLSLSIVMAVAVGVAAAVSVGSFADDLKRAVHVQARAVLGADVYVSRSTPFDDEIEHLVGEMARDGGLAGTPGDDFARVTILQAMARVGEDRARLVQLNALSGGYPFYGDHYTEPADAWQTLADDDAAIVEPTLLAMTGAQVGDTMAIGSATFVIRAVVRDLPGSVSLVSSLGPRVFIPRRSLEATGLARETTRAQHRAFLRLPEGVDPDALVARHRPRLEPQRVVVRTVSENEGRLGERLDRLARYLRLVGLLAVLLGGIGVASAVGVLMRRRLDTVAILRCLGAESQGVLLVYWVQVTWLATAGSVAGAAFGAGLQQLMPGLVRGLLPIEIDSAPSLGAIAQGLSVGWFAATLAAAAPLLAVRRASPLRALRAGLEPLRARRVERIALAGAVAAGVFALAWLHGGDVRTAAAFTAAIAVVVALLAWVARALALRVPRLLPRRLAYLWRQGFLNLHRPHNQTVAVVVALGFGAFLLGAIFLVEQNLLRDLRGGGASRDANLVFFDVQSEQLEPLRDLVRGAGHELLLDVPIVPMRIRTVGARTVEEILAEAVAGDDAGSGQRDDRTGRWAFRREYRSTYRNHLTTAETTVAGDWAPDTGPPWPISLEADLADELGVGLGAAITWDVLGRSLETRVAHLRAVQWTRFEPNFFAVFPEAALAAAPQTRVALVRVNDDEARGRLQRSVSDRFPNVSAIDLTDVLRTLEAVIDRASLALRFTAGFSLLAGAAVLAGTVAASRAQRTREGALLKVLGATRRQVFVVWLAEYASLGALAACAGGVLAVAGGWAVVRFVFDQPFALPAARFAGLALALAATSVAVGLVGGVSALRRTPLELLRSD